MVADDPDAQNGDRLVLRIRNQSDKHRCLFRYGDSNHLGIEQCYIKVPWKIEQTSTP